jgi:predicted NBD/HSP70 family sugar kinase
LSGSQAPAREPRWQGALDLIAEMRRRPGITRADAARRRGLGSGSATDIIARLRRVSLIDETPAPTGARGRPTGVLSPHPDGPVVLAIDIRRSGWHSAYAGIDGQPHRFQPRGPGNPPDRVISELGAAVAQARDRFGTRLRAVAVAVAGTVRNGRVVHSAALGWKALDLAGIAATGDLPLLIGNDATLAATAEARSGAASAARTSLHLTVMTGIGGALIADGQPLTGATGAGGEFGHLPFGDPAMPCPCGARGCWDMEVDGRTLARLLGDPVPGDPYRYANEVIAAASGDTQAMAAVTHVATSLARGIAGLVNACDPEIVTLGGLGPSLADAAAGAFEDSYRRGLMSFRRALPPPVVTAGYQEDGPLRGAIEVALDTVISETGLTLWSAKQARNPATGSHARG